MKIFNAKQIKAWDTISVKNQDISPVYLMERAANTAFMWICKCMQPSEKEFSVFCGVGNNGGDGLVISRLLYETGCKVSVYIVHFKDEYSEEFAVNLDKLKQLNIPIIVLKSQEDIINIKPADVIIDAVFGIGLSKTPAVFVQDIFREINKQKSYVVSIDIPSGLYLDKMPCKTDAIVEADVTLTFQSPKLVFFLPSLAIYSNDVVILDIGLDDNFGKNEQSNIFYIDKKFIVEKYKSVSRYAHKGTLGHALIIGGSYGKIGAVALAGKACLKAGCGLVTVYSPKCGYVILQTSCPELMVLTDVNEYFITRMQFDLKPKAIGMGIGMGTDRHTLKAFNNFLKSNTTALVVDADAINALSANKQWLTLLPANTIITPHKKELERLVGEWVDDFDMLEKTKALSKQYKLIVVIKGATTITVNGDILYVNSTGNQGLATAGSGDVLLGIITSLLTQSYEPIEAAILGVYLHGLTANIAVKETGYQSLTASTVIDYLGKAYLELEKDKITSSPIF